MKNLSRQSRRVAALAVAALAIAGAAALAQGGKTGSAPVAHAMTAAVAISSYSFHPAALTIKKGSTVVWVNRDDDVHTIKSTDGPEAFGSAALDSGGRFKFMFQRAGTYHYTCSVHPYMHGVIVVR